MSDQSPALARRRFLQGGAALAGAAALTGFDALAAQVAGARGAPTSRGAQAGYGQLVAATDATTGEALVKLPRGFRYLTFGRTGEVMDDGIPTPGSHDGMAALAVGPYVHLVRNHERGAGPAFASGMTYDAAGGAGGTTTLVFDPRRGELLGSRASLAGTIRNCAGGPTTWGSWLSCEETTEIRDGVRHGYVFEVPADGPSNGEPLREMGRFSHEAVAVDPRTGYVYLTEDATPSGLYRYVPRRPGRLAAGGRLQMLKIGSETRSTYDDDTGTDYGRVRWVDIDQPDPGPGETSTVEQGMAQGGATFSRGEGIWWGHGRIYFVSTDGGPTGNGQIFELNPTVNRLRVLFASPAEEVLGAPDNITVSPRGGIVLCEDGGGAQFLHGLTRSGDIFPFAENILNGSEWAGATFDQWGQWLFVNLQTPGITMAITGPWRSGAL